MERSKASLGDGAQSAQQLRVPMLVIIREREDEDPGTPLAYRTKQKQSHRIYCNQNGRGRHRLSQYARPYSANTAAEERASVVSLLRDETVEHGGFIAGSRAMVWIRSWWQDPCQCQHGLSPAASAQDARPRISALISKVNRRCSGGFVGGNHPTDPIILSEDIKRPWASCALTIKSPIPLTHFVSVLTLDFQQKDHQRYGAEPMRVDCPSNNN